MLLLRDVLLILVAVGVVITCLVLAHTLGLARRYPIQHAWYYSKPLQRNYVGAAGVPTAPRLTTPSFMELALNHTYPALPSPARAFCTP